MSVSTTLVALKTLHATLGVTATTTLPASLNASELPRVLVYPGAAVWNPHTIGKTLSLKRSQRQYRVELYVKPYGQGAGVDEGFQAVLPYLESFPMAYLNDPTLSNAVDIIADAGVFGDEGVVRLTYAGNDYWGAVFTPSFIEKTT